MREHGLKILTRVRLAIIIATGAAGAALMGVALAAPAVPTPTILAHPADPTSQVYDAAVLFLAPETACTVNVWLPWASGPA